MACIILMFIREARQHMESLAFQESILQHCTRYFFRFSLDHTYLHMECFTFNSFEYFFKYFDLNQNITFVIFCERAIESNRTIF